MKISLISTKNNMNMKLNKISGIILGIAALSQAMSCSDDFLQKSNPNQINQETYWQTENDALMALTACYDALQSTDLYNNQPDGSFGFLHRETSTDNGYKTRGAYMQGSTIWQGTSAPTDACFSKYWTACYEVIKRCNTLISNIDRVEMDQEKINSYKAEAIALRSLMYCNLTSVFRDVPYLTEPLTLETAEAPKALKADIAEGVISDMKEYVTYLPAKGSEPAGRMTREAGYAILGRIALFNQRWEDAIDAYKQVIGKASLFKSGDGSDYKANFADLFKEENENCSEILLSVHYVGGNVGEGSKFGMCYNKPCVVYEATMDLCDDFYCTDGLPIDKSALFNGSLEKGAHTHEHPDYRRYENRDPRLKATLCVPGEEWNGKKLEEWADFKNNKPYSTCVIRKWFKPEDPQNIASDSGMDYYIIRYAEVLLSLAEAMNEAGYPAADITQYINEVRARVGMPAVEEAAQIWNNGAPQALDQEYLRQIIRHERRVELAFEDLRFADLYRWGEWKTAIDNMTHEKDFYGLWTLAFSPGYRGPQDEVWPIPQSEIDTNPQLEQHAEWQ